jgi:hypothetical protein
MTRFAGHDCVRLGNGSLTLWITESVGPRIIALALPGSENLLAELLGETLECPGEGSFSFYGGHRLWYAPEEPRRTYLPDDAPVSVTDLPDGVLVTQPVEERTGIQKSLAISLPGMDARVLVDHTISNLSREPVELAPWAITQLRPGGLAILPQATAFADEHGVVPNRHIALWPYTPIRSPHIIWGDRYILVEATMHSGALKLGFPNPVGWMAYALGDTVFVKYAPYLPSATYFDRGSSSECYCNPRFLELETLGPRTTLSPGESVTHREIWMIYAEVTVPTDEAAMQALVDQLGMTEGA